MMACEVGHLQIVEVLLNYSADIEMRSSVLFFFNFFQYAYTSFWRQCTLIFLTFLFAYTCILDRLDSCDGGMWKWASRCCPFVGGKSSQCLRQEQGNVYIHVLIRIFLKYFTYLWLFLLWIKLNKYYKYICVYIEGTHLSDGCLPQWPHRHYWVPLELAADWREW